MATPFVSSDLFEIVVKYAQVNLKSGLSAIIIIKTDEHEKKYGDKMQVLKSQWQQPNWKEHSDLHSDSLITDDVTGVKNPDYNIYRQFSTVFRILRDATIQHGRVAKSRGTGFFCEDRAEHLLLQMFMAIEKVREKAAILLLLLRLQSGQNGMNLIR